MELSVRGKWTDNHGRKQITIADVPAWACEARATKIRPRDGGASLAGDGGRGKTQEQSWGCRQYTQFILKGTDSTNLFILSGSMWFSVRKGETRSRWGPPEAGENPSPRNSLPDFWHLNSRVLIGRRQPLFELSWVHFMDPSNSSHPFSASPPRPTSGQFTLGAQKPLKWVRIEGWTDGLSSYFIPKAGNSCPVLFLILNSVQPCDLM